ncbi:hypothetical protein SAMN05216403_12316 [Nitrosospira multiformis ATCC 25196]|uniref:Uncharacterized protein n=1 Tax=Nitrosospira multiformis (strain ATCC 25196 / NCIMB 11849 / C 71) TaxID=323848 RepID=A0A1H5WST7_NITMU|nr:hypothetical protein SAMN05216403_12316 [Nitrosospira multiformis ATCC 25196]
MIQLPCEKFGVISLRLRTPESPMGGHDEDFAYGRETGYCKHESMLFVRLPVLLTVIIFCFFFPTIL